MVTDYNPIGRNMYIVSALSGLVSLMALIGCTGGAPMRPLVYEVMEELPRGAFVANLLSDLNLDSSNLPHLSLVSQGPSDLFYMDNRTGFIYTASVIDREQECPRQLECVIPLNILVQYTDTFHMVKVMVKVIDINDNNPQFPQPTMELSVSEATLPGTEFPLPLAEDPDSGLYGVQSYNLSSDVFGIHINNDSDSGFEVNLVLLRPLDRETTDTYTLQILASDRGSPSLMGTLDMTVLVADVNDNSPRFDQDSYRVELPEDVNENTAIVQVRATDADIGQNGDILYLFSAHTQSEIERRFRVDSNTGEVFVSAPLDFESQKSYTLSIVAQDKGSNPLHQYTKVVVDLLDVNDNPPRITFNTVSKTGHVQVRENAEVGTFVAHVMVNDLDSGENGQVTCSMNSQHFELRQLFEGEFQVVTGTSFDRETQSKYHINLVCKDGGKPALTSTKHAKVTVEDENDNAPQFTEKVYSVSMTENNHQGALITTLTALDKDTGSNSLVQYTLLQPDSEVLPVAIDQSSGAMYATRIFDFEKEKHFICTVIASDGDEPQMSSSVEVVVNIEDTNDEAPIFDKERYRFNVTENMQRNTEVGIVSATDIDSHPYNKIKFSLDMYNDDAKSFWLDELSGTLFTKIPLDREVKDSYSLTVIASNPDQPQRHTRAEVFISVLDVNDNEPVVSFPTYTNNTLYISNQIPLGKKIAQIQAHDLDLGSNGNVTFSIENGSSSLFSLTPAGVLSPATDLSDIEYQVCYIFIRAADQGKPSLETVSSLILVVDRDISTGSSSYWGHQNRWIIVTSFLVPLAVVILLATLLVRFCLTRKTSQTPAGEKTILSSEGTSHNGTLESILEHSTVNHTPPGGTAVEQDIPADGAKGLCTDQADTTWPHSDLQTPPRAHSTALSSMLSDDTSSPQRHLADMSGTLRSPDKRNLRVQWLDLCSPDSKHPQGGQCDQDESSDTGSSTDSGRGVSDEGESSHPSPTLRRSHQPSSSVRMSPTDVLPRRATRERQCHSLVEPLEGATDYQRHNLEMCLKHPEYFRGVGVSAPGLLHPRASMPFSTCPRRPVSQYGPNTVTRTHSLTQCPADSHTVHPQNPEFCNSRTGLSNTGHSACRFTRPFPQSQQGALSAHPVELLPPASAHLSNTHHGTCTNRTHPSLSVEVVPGPSSQGSTVNGADSEEESEMNISADSSTTSGSYSMDVPESDSVKQRQDFGSQSSFLI